MAFGSVLCSATYLLMAACRSTMPTKVPRLRRRLVSRAKKPSTAFSHEALVGVKWKVARGWRASQATTLGCLWGPPRWLQGDHVQRRSLPRRSQCASPRLSRREPHGNPIPDSTVAFNPLATSPPLSPRWLMSQMGLGCVKTPTGENAQNCFLSLLFSTATSGVPPVTDILSPGRHVSKMPTD
jgi:hypothetical protein